MGGVISRICIKGVACKEYNQWSFKLKYRGGLPVIKILWNKMNNKLRKFQSMMHKHPKQIEGVENKHIWCIAVISLIWSHLQ